jgi:hypothetical protein
MMWSSRLFPRLFPQALPQLLPHSSLHAGPRLPRLQRRSTLAAPSAFRVEVQPPSLCHAPASGWQRLMFWLLAPAPQDASPPLNRLPGVRSEFLGTLADIHSESADALRWRIQNARSLRDLWHLRSEVYSVVGVALSESQAEQRVTLLNRHFPTKAARSQSIGP